VLSRVSVIIPTHNRAEFLAEAIDSALSQTHAPTEVIVIDDGSTDNTAEVLSGYGNRIKAVRQQNRGVSAARNAGVALASGDLLAFLDADDVWMPKKLERQVARFQAEPDLGLVHCGVDEIDAEGARLRRVQDGLEGWVADDMLMFRRSVILGGGSGAMIPRALFKDIGGFDETLSTSADWDLYYRVARKHRVGFIADVLVGYRIHGSNMHSDIAVMERDMVRGYVKAFMDAGPHLLSLRRRCHGNLHRMLAGSYYRRGNYWSFLRHSIKALVLTPENAAWFLAYPVRRFRARVQAESRASRAGET
jgi:glycosyltransferase involved in cell wall biosynthesis